MVSIFVYELFYLLLFFLLCWWILSLPSKNNSAQQSDLQIKKIYLNFSMDKQYQEVFHKDDRNKKGTEKAKKRTNVRQARIRNEKMIKRQLQKKEEQALSNVDKNIIQEKNQTYINGKVKKEQRMKLRQKQRKQQEQEDEQTIMKLSKKIKRN